MRKIQSKVWFQSRYALFVCMALSLAFCTSGRSSQDIGVTATQPEIAVSTRPSHGKRVSTAQPGIAVETQHLQNDYLPLIEKNNPCLLCYYIDSVDGSDSNPGKQIDKPWKTLAKLNSEELSPGSTVFLKRGSKWDDRLEVVESGEPGNPITFTAYGSGEAPIIFTPAGQTKLASAVRIHGSWIVVEGLHIQEAVAGFSLVENAQHNIIQMNEIDNSGIGVVILGTNNLVTRNYIHDLDMVVNTSGGDGDDYGAIGVDILNDNNEVSYNEFINCEAPSFDFGLDGGAVEIWQNGDNTSVHHNWSMNTEGFMEVSSDGTGSAKNVTISYNVMINATGFNVIHISDEHATQIENFRVENNTFVDLRTHDPRIGSVIWFAGTPPSESYIFRNNIVYVKDYYWVSGTTDQFVHTNNIFYFVNPDTRTRFLLGTGDTIADPQFIDLSTNDFRLKPTSPAVDNGLSLGLDVDFDGNPVPTNEFTDIGAYEFQGVP